MELSRDGDERDGTPELSSQTGRASSLSPFRNAIPGKDSAFALALPLREDTAIALCYHCPPRLRRHLSPAVYTGASPLARRRQTAAGGWRAGAGYKRWLVPDSHVRYSREPLLRLAILQGRVASLHPSLLLAAHVLRSFPPAPVSRLLSPLSSLLSPPILLPHPPPAPSSRTLLLRPPLP